jgi:predicted translin family RNA/ssDNA-binding protein
MLRTIKGDDGKPYISLEDLMYEVYLSKNDLESKLNEGLDDDDEFSVDNIEDRIDFLEKLYDSLKNMQTDYYKKILGM